MARYIDADALMKELEREVELADDWKTAHEIHNVVKYFPTADVVEQKHGEWINTRQDAPMFGFYYCSLCGRRRTSPQDNFCPNCGADMRKETEDGND